MTTPLIALVTGANKGIGREIARGLAELGHTVIVGGRSLDQGEAVAAGIRADGGTASAVALDVLDDASVAAAARTVRAEHGRLDALVNNAGISRKPGADPFEQLPRAADVDHVRYVFETNVFGVIRVTGAFLPLLRESEHPRIVNMSSTAGSLASVSDFSNPEPLAIGYVPSKTALNAVTVLYARDLAEYGILVNAVAPGFIATDLNGFRGTGTPEEGARQAIRMATIPADGPTGTFTDADGSVAW